MLKYVQMNFSNVTDFFEKGKYFVVYLIFSEDKQLRFMRLTMVYIF